MPRVVIAGGNGFLGRALAGHLLHQGWEVVTLSREGRNAREGIRAVPWNGRDVGPWADEVNGAQALVNYVGRSINCRFTSRHRREILDSRVHSVTALGEAVRRCAAPPAVWLQASAIGIYGNAEEKLCDETAPIGEGFIADVCRQWEAALHRHRLPQTRKVVFRIGPVLGRGDGALPRLIRLTKWGMGGRVGRGTQWFSWVHLEDVIRAAVWAIEHAGPSETYNLTAPGAIRNRDLMRALRGALGVRFGLPAPALAARLGAWLMGIDPSLALSGQRCPPSRLLADGFGFRFSTLAAALGDLIPDPGPRGHGADHIGSFHRSNRDSRR